MATKEREREKTRGNIPCCLLEGKCSLDMRGADSSAQRTRPEVSRAKHIEMANPSSLCLGHGEHLCREDARCGHWSPEPVERERTE